MNMLEVVIEGIQEIEEGSLSKRFKNCLPGEIIELEGPFGFFTLSQEETAI